MIEITLNGAKMEIQPDATLVTIASGLGIDKSRVVALVNGEIVKIEDFATVAFQHGDKVELVRFVGGG